MKRRFYIILAVLLVVAVSEGCKSRRKNRCATCPTWSSLPVNDVKLIG